MNKKEYIIGQLGRTKNKKYESYVVFRIINLLNDFSIKFVTQQHVTLTEGRALTDLFFPQIGLHIEVDEEPHKYNLKADKERERDIVSRTNHQLERVDVSKSLEDVNRQIDRIVDRVRREVNRLKNKKEFTPWDIDSEFKPETYIKLGYIDVADNVVFKTAKDVCNCFGHNYDGWQRGGASHPHDPAVILWFPKLFPNGEWNNKISFDEETIIESNVNAEKTRAHALSCINDKEKYKHRRVVFAKAKGDFGNTLYRFKGLYELDLSESGATAGLIWKRKETPVPTYAPS